MEWVLKKIRGVFWNLSQLLKNMRSLFKIILLLFLAAIVIVVAYLCLQLGSVSFDSDIYIFNTGTRFDYHGKSRIMRTKESVTLRNNKENILLDASPVYFNETRILLPQLMLLVKPESGKLGRTEYYTRVYAEDGSIFAHIGNMDIDVNKGFLFDGKDTYVFLDKTVVKWGNRSISLDPFSYVIVIYNQRMEIYPANGDDPLLLQTWDSDVSAECESGYSIDMSKDILLGESGEMLLFSNPSLINLIR